MSKHVPGEVTRYLIAWSQGDLAALDKVFTLVFQDLRHIARKSWGKVPGSELEPTELIGEIYRVLLRQKTVHWQTRGQFYKFAAFLMERVLLEYKRGLRAQKRGGGTVQVVPIIEALDVAAPGDGSAFSPAASSDVRTRRQTELFEALGVVVDIAEAIDELAKLDPRQAEIVRLYYYVGLKVEEIAEDLGVSPRTVSRWLRHAKRFLASKLGDYDRRR